MEDAIALRLAANETGTELHTLPPGKIYGMSVTEPSNEVASPSSPSSLELRSVSLASSSSRHSIDGDCSTGAEEATSPGAGPSSTGGGGGATAATVSQTALDMLAQLFPHRKRSVLELVLLRIIEPLTTCHLSLSFS